MILLVNSTWWPCASRLAIALTKAGCAVSAVYPAHGHPLAKTAVIQKRYPYRPIRPLPSLAQAIQDVRPHLVIPCDDRAVQHLHELHAQQADTPRCHVRAVIERSLGAPSSYAIADKRYSLLRIATALGIPVPETEMVDARSGLDRWASQHNPPWIVKADGTWGGHGTRFVHSRREGEAIIRQMSRPLSAGRTFKRLMVDRDPFWILPWYRGSTPQLVVQDCIEGYPANCAVVSWDGKVLAGFAVEVLSAQGPTGAATIVRMVESPDMMRAAEQIVARLHLSGFLGFDFIIQASTGTPYLIEMNPRVTPLCHLPMGPGRDMVSALTAHLSKQPPLQTSSAVQKDTIAYFPQAWHSNDRDNLLACSFHDVPWEEPQLIQELLRLPWPDRGTLARLLTRLRPRKHAAVVFDRPHSRPSTSAGYNWFRANPRKPPAVVPVRPSGSRPPLFLFTGVDGAIDYRYYNLVRYLDPDQPVYAVLSQALLGEPWVLTRIEALAAYYLEQIRMILPKGPYHFLGYSFGGYVAFEAARQLASRGELVGMLGMIDTLPMGAGSRSPYSEAAEFYRRRKQRATIRITVHAGMILRQGGLRYIWDKLRGFTVNTLRPRVLRVVYTLLDSLRLPVPSFLRSSIDLGWLAAARYAPRPFPVQITYFQTARSPERPPADYDLWSNLTGRTVEVLDIDGDHEVLFDEPHVRSLARAITDGLARLP